MAETLSPPPLRQPVVDRAALLLEREWASWQELLWQQIGWLRGQLTQGLLGQGQADKLAVWSSPDTLTYDSLLYWDRVNHRMGLGTVTPKAPLTFADTIGQKILLYAGGQERYGLGIAGSQLQVFAAGPARVSLGSMNNTDAVTFTSILDISTAGVHIPASPVGIGTPPVNGWHLTTGGYPSRFNGNVAIHAHTGLAYDPPVNVWTRSGSIAADSIYLGSGDVAPRYQLDCPGWGFMGLLGVGYAPDVNYSIRAGTSYFDNLTSALDVRIDRYLQHIGPNAGINGWADLAWGLRVYGQAYYDASVDIAGNLGLAVWPPTQRLDVNGYAYIRAGAGIGTPPVGGYALRVSGAPITLLGPVGIGYDGASGIWLKAGNSVLDALTVTGATTLTGITGIGGAPNGSHHLTCHGASYLYGAVGVGGGGAISGWQFAVTGNSWLRGATQFEYGLTCTHAFEGLRCSNVGSTVGTWNPSNYIAFGWDGSYVRCRVDDYQAGAVSLTFPSDIRVKEAIQLDVPGLQAVCRLQPVSFQYIRQQEAYGYPRGRQYGLLAQETAPHAPLAVRPEGGLEGWLIVDYPALVPVLIQALQELAQQVHTLEELYYGN